MTTRYQITEEARQQLLDAEETLRQIIKGNTESDGFEARAALRKLGSALSSVKEISPAYSPSMGLAGITPKEPA